ncbi:Sulfate adenylyltransferase subunit 1, partial [Frankliniella fusca]
VAVALHFAHSTLQSKKTDHEKPKLAAPTEGIPCVLRKPRRGGGIILQDCPLSTANESAICHLTLPLTPLQGSPYEGPLGRSVVFAVLAPRYRQIRPELGQGGPATYFDLSTSSIKFRVFQCNDISQRFLHTGSF